MPLLKKMLQSYDLDLIERIGSLWGADLTNLDLSSSIEVLAKAMLDRNLFTEILESLPKTAREAWNEIAYNPQKTTWAQFTRKYGEVREFGPARRDREAPERHPSSTAEVLWYRGLIGRAFMNLPPEPREFVFIPDEFQSPLEPETDQRRFFIKPLDENLVVTETPADTRLLDHATDWLAARRKGTLLPATAWHNWRENDTFIKVITKAAGLTDQKDNPNPEALSDFFQKDRNTILLEWMNHWMDSVRYNDLKIMPGLVFEGEWQNDPRKPRQLVLEILKNLKSGEWYGLTALVEQIKTNQPDFQRPSGDYDSWFIRKADNGDYLRGFIHWDEIDGALIRFLVTGPMHWLGMLDLGKVTEKSEPCFRLTPLFDAFFRKEAAVLRPAKKATLQITPDLVFTIPVLVSRTLRYQIARFCDVRAITESETVYEITAGSLLLAQQNGLKPLQLVQLLEKQLKKPLPYALTLLSEKWEKTGRAALVEQVVLLRAQSSEILTMLQNNPSTGKYILETLSPTTAVINPGGIKAIKKTLLEQGLLTEVILKE